ncbi:hypothetical protein BKA64DRAFT_751132 [Cadophora sp. MPI-SDFR-AT-0126]|nr:hypothetical protein BKA64DRAFT_751132 [Leotiomycetes sp. MPI-SDFR-AT-0126]
MPANPTPDEPSPECLKAISILIKLPAELRAMIFETVITQHISSSYKSVRSPLCIALAELSTSPSKSHQILYGQSLAAWDEKERKTFRITDQACVLDLDAKKRKDRLAIEHLVFDLENFYHEKTRGHHGGPLINLRGQIITLSNNLRTICFRARAPFLKDCLVKDTHDQTPIRDFPAIVRSIVPAAVQTLEQVVIEIPAQYHLDSMRTQENNSDDTVNLDLHGMDARLGTCHEKRRNPRGDWFILWSRPFDPSGKHVWEQNWTYRYVFSPCLGFLEEGAS